MGRQPYSERAAPASGSVPTGLRRPVVATLMLAALLSLFFSAGFWQLDRADQKQAVLDTFASAEADEHYTQLVPDEAAETLRFRSFSLTGHYLPDKQILLDNITNGGINGYEVLTAFRTGNGYVMVNRGWIRAAGDRQLLPDISVSGSGSERTIIARLNYLPSPGLKLGQPAAPATSQPARLLFPDRAALQQQLSITLPDYQLQLDPGQTDGYLRTWKAVTSGPEKHLGYAMQWFSFAALAVIFYCILIYQWWRSRSCSETRNS